MHIISKILFQQIIDAAPIGHQRYINMFVRVQQFYNPADHAAAITSMNAQMKNVNNLIALTKATEDITKIKDPALWDADMIAKYKDVVSHLQRHAATIKFDFINVLEEHNPNDFQNKCHVILTAAQTIKTTLAQTECDARKHKYEDLFMKMYKFSKGGGDEAWNAKLKDGAKWQDWNKLAKDTIRKNEDVVILDKSAEAVDLVYCFICIHIIHEGFAAADTLYLQDSSAGIQGKRWVQRLHISLRGRSLTDGNSRLCAASRAHQKPLCLSTAKHVHSVCISVFAGGT